MSMRQLERATLSSCIIVNQRCGPDRRGLVCMQANHMIEQQFEFLAEADKYRSLGKLLEREMDGSRILIFCETKRGCDAVTRQLRMDGWPALSIHGDKEQRERDWVLAVSAAPCQHCKAAQQKCTAEVHSNYARHVCTAVIQSIYGQQGCRAPLHGNAQHNCTASMPRWALLIADSIPDCQSGRGTFMIKAAEDTCSRRTSW